jgi:hypothetical protein
MAINAIEYNPGHRDETAQSGTDLRPLTSDLRMVGNHATDAIDFLKNAIGAGMLRSEM